MFVRLACTLTLCLAELWRGRYGTSMSGKLTTQQCSKEQRSVPGRIRTELALQLGSKSFLLPRGMLEEQEGSASVRYPGEEQYIAVFARFLSFVSVAVWPLLS